MLFSLEIMFSCLWIFFFCLNSCLCCAELNFIHKKSYYFVKICCIECVVSPWSIHQLKKQAIHLNMWVLNFYFSSNQKPSTVESEANRVSPSAACGHNHSSKSSMSIASHCATHHLELRSLPSLISDSSYGIFFSFLLANESKLIFLMI